MSPPVTTTKTIQHFSHQAHPLTELHGPKEYHCDGCKMLGSGTRYRCNTCDFDLHKVCGTSPSSITSSRVHPEHELTLIVTKQNDRFCDVCGELVKGLLSYRCKICEFDVHPICNQLPQTVQHGIHPQHPLTLQPPPSSSEMQHSLCTICNFLCKNWSYKCEEESCGGGGGGVHLHPNCVTHPWSPPPPSVPEVQEIDTVSVHDSLSFHAFNRVDNERLKVKWNDDSASHGSTINMNRFLYDDVFEYED